MRRVLLICILLIVLLGPASMFAAPEQLFSMRDPLGDDIGDGSIAYPQDSTFHRGVLDLTRFSVLADETHYAFRFRFAHIANPWNAPEGFYHPRIDVFIDTAQGLGRTDPLRPGPGEVRFSELHPWDVWLRIAPWDGARLFAHDDPPDSPGYAEGLHLRLADEFTIEALVPKSLITLSGEESYYVLVGSFDALGIDGYREVQAHPSRWLLTGENRDLRVVDLLAPGLGGRAQKRQLRQGIDGAIRLEPVGGGRGWKALWPLLLAAVILGMSGSVVWWSRRT